tara:strand:+ start:624 stop:725 length:102 start_codon:yes stop_codon:yes gene_type:complete
VKKLAAEMLPAFFVVVGITVYLAKTGMRNHRIE